MRKLLSANFSRMFRSKIYWLCAIFMTGFAAFSVCSRYFQTIKYENFPYSTADGLWFIGGMYISVIIAVFVSLWIGTDYSDGTFRNKIMVGHTRRKLYFSNLIVCNVCALIIHIAYMLVIAGMAWWLLKPFETPIRVLCVMSLVSVLSLIALTSIFVLIAMLIHTKAIGAVVSLLVAMLLIIASMTIYNMLDAPEYIEPIEMTINGELVQMEPQPNPRYLDGTKREIYQHTLNLIPTGQMIQYGELAYPEDLACFPLYSLAVILLSTGIGTAIFKKKDLR